MTRIILTAVAVFGTVTFAAGGAATPAATLREVSPKADHWELWRYASPGPQIFVGLEWKGFQSAPEYAAIRKFSVARGIPGEEIFNELERILVVMSSDPKRPKAAKPDLFAVAHGNFDFAKLRKFAAAEGAVLKRARGIEFVVAPDAAVDDPVVALVDSSTIMVGSRDRVLEAIDRSRRAGPPTPELNALSNRAAELSLVNQLWAVSAVRPFESFPAGGPAAILSGVETLDAGLNFNNVFELNVALGAKSAEDANRLKAALQAAMQLAAAQSPVQNPEIDEALKAVEWKSNGTMVAMRFALSREKVTSMVAAMAGKPAEPLDLGGFPSASTPAVWGVAAKPAVTRTVVPAEPLKPKVIRIEGLDSGVIEIPYNKAN